MNYCQILSHLVNKAPGLDVPSLRSASSVSPVHGGYKGNNLPLKAEFCSANSAHRERYGGKNILDMKPL